MSEIIITLYDTKTRKMTGNSAVITIGSGQGLYIDLQGGHMRFCYAGDTVSTDIPNGRDSNDTVVTEIRRPDKPTVYNRYAKPDILDLIS